MQQVANRRERRAQEREAEKAKRRRKVAIARAKKDPPRLADAPPGSLSGPQRICLSAIFREDDPAPVARCLESVRPFICAWRIADSGCTDDVRATIRRVLAGLPGEIIPIAWTGFADARNIALDAARETGADFALFIDGDDYLEPRGLRPVGDRLVLPALQPIQWDFVRVEQVSSRMVTPSRIFMARLSAPARWESPVHERLVHAPDAAVGVLPEYRYHYTRTDPGSDRAGLEAKTRKYLATLLDIVRENPNDHVGAYNLAAHHHMLRDFAAAVPAFDRALELLPQGNSLRYSAALYRAEAMALRGDAPDDVVAAFELATAMAPERAEAPRWLADYLSALERDPARVRELHRYADTLSVPAGASGVHLTAYREYRRKA